MPRVSRIDKADLVYHITNRANGRQRIFSEDKDYLLFEHIVQEAQERTKMCIYSFSVMPNHWHFVLQPTEDGDLATFFHWLTVTHTTRWHVVRGSEGQGHVYQGTYKSNICQNDQHFLQLARYVERNPLRANLVQKAEDWQWSSVWRREFGTEVEKQLLDEWPYTIPKNYLNIINEPQSEDELDSIRRALKRGSPFGKGVWQDEMVVTHGLESTIRPLGRPKKGT